MSVVTLENFKIYIRDEAKGINDPTLQSYLDAAEEAFGNATSRYYNLVTGATTATARSYAAEGCTDILRIHDCTEITAVVENGTTLATSAYQAEPVGVTWSGRTVPFEQIRKLRSYWYVDAGRAAITVTAKWGWASIPAQVTEAIKIIGKDLCSNQDVRFGIVSVTDAAAFSARTNPIVRVAINDQQRLESVFLA